MNNTEKAIRGAALLESVATMIPATKILLWEVRDIIGELEKARQTAETQGQQLPDDIAAALEATGGVTVYPEGMDAPASKFGNATTIQMWLNKQVKTEKKD